MFSQSFGEDCKPLPPLTWGSGQPTILPMKKCDFCPEERWATGLVGSPYFYVVPDKHPATCGHLLIIAKRHIETYFDLTPQEAAALHGVITQAKDMCLSPAVRSFYEGYAAGDPDPRTQAWCRQALADFDVPITGYNIGINNGASAGQTIMHLHIHLIPRRDGDVDGPAGGVRHVIPGRGNYKG